MFINPHEAIQNGWIKFPDWMEEDFRQKCIQPNAIDITLDRAFYVSKVDSFFLSEDTKHMRPQYEIQSRPTPVLYDIHKVDAFHFHEGNVYDVVSDFYVDIPEGVVAELIVRSTLNRNGLFVTAGLYDSGFKGSIGAALHNRGYNAYIVPHTRFAQIKFLRSDNNGLYSGGYNTEQNKHWTEK